MLHSYFWKLVNERLNDFIVLNYKLANTWLLMPNGDVKTPCISFIIACNSSLNHNYYCIIWLFVYLGAEGWKSLIQIVTRDKVQIVFLGWLLPGCLDKMSVSYCDKKQMGALRTVTFCWFLIYFQFITQYSKRVL